MGAIVSAILSWFFGAFSRLYLTFQMHFLASKFLFVTVMMLLLPAVLNNLIYELFDALLSLISERIQSPDVQNATSLFRMYQFTGLAGWLLSVFRIPDAFSVVVSAIAISFVLRSIPMVRW